MSSQDKIIYQLKQENASLRGNVELLTSENEHLRSQSSPIKREEGMHLLSATLKILRSLHVHVYTRDDDTSVHQHCIITICDIHVLASGGEYESQLHSRDEVIYQLKQKVDSLQSENERLRSQFYPEPIKEEGINKHFKK